MLKMALLSGPSAVDIHRECWAIREIGERVKQRTVSIGPRANELILQPARVGNEERWWWLWLVKSLVRPWR